MKERGVRGEGEREELVILVISPYVNIHTYMHM